MVCYITYEMLNMVLDGCVYTRPGITLVYLVDLRA